MPNLFVRDSSTFLNTIPKVWTGTTWAAADIKPGDDAGWVSRVGLPGNLLYEDIQFDAPASAFVVFQTNGIVSGNSGALSSWIQSTNPSGSLYEMFVTATGSTGFLSSNVPLSTWTAINTNRFFQVDVNPFDNAAVVLSVAIRRINDGSSPASKTVSLGAISQSSGGGGGGGGDILPF